MKKKIKKGSIFMVNRSHKVYIPYKKENDLIGLHSIIIGKKTPIKPGRFQLDNIITIKNSNIKYFLLTKVSSLNHKRSRTDKIIIYDTVESFQRKFFEVL